MVFILFFFEIGFCKRPFQSQKCQHQYLRSNIFWFLEGVSHRRYKVSLWRRCQMSGIEKWQRALRLRINDAHHMCCRIFSSWCVKGELGPWNSRLGTPPRESRETEGIERLIWYSSYVLCLSMVWMLSGEDESKYKHGYTYVQVVWGFWFRVRKKWRHSMSFPGVLLICMLAVRCLRYTWWYRSPVISRTVRNTLSFSGSKGSILW